MAGDEHILHLHDVRKKHTPRPRLWKLSEKKPGNEHQEQLRYNCIHVTSEQNLDGQKVCLKPYPLKLPSAFNGRRTSFALSNTSSSISLVTSSGRFFTNSRQLSSARTQHTLLPRTGMLEQHKRSAQTHPPKPVCSICEYIVKRHEATVTLNHTLLLVLIVICPIGSWTYPHRLCMNSSGTAATSKQLSSPQDRKRAHKTTILAPTCRQQKIELAKK